MGRKDAKRFIAIEKKLEELEKDQDLLLGVQEKILRNWKFSLVLAREIIDKMIERE